MLDKSRLLREHKSLYYRTSKECNLLAIFMVGSELYSHQICIFCCWVGWYSCLVDWQSAIARSQMPCWMAPVSHLYRLVWNLQTCHIWRYSTPIYRHWTYASCCLTRRYPTWKLKHPHWQKLWAPICRLWPIYTWTHWIWLFPLRWAIWPDSW